MIHDMTKGNPFSNIFMFVIPIFLGNLFQQIYVIADTVIVSRLLGVEALAAVGCVGGFNFMVIGFAQGLTMGFNAIISQRFGAKDEEGMRKAYQTSTVLSLLVCAAVSMIFLIISRPLLLFTNTPDNIIDDANAYISIIYMFLLCPTMYNYYAGVLRGMGDSKTPLLFIVVSSILNIVLDVVSILVFHMGVRGAALATVLSQGISALLCLIYLKKKFNVFTFAGHGNILDLRLCRELLGVGLPGAFMYCITALSVIIVQAALNGFGSDSIAAYSVGMKIENVVSVFYPALGMGISTYAAQNLGAMDYTRIKKGFLVSNYINIGYTVFAITLLQFLSKPMVQVFIEGDVSNEVVKTLAVQYVTDVRWFFLFLGMIFIYRTGSQGLGSGRIPMYASILELIARILTAFTLTKLFGFRGIALSNAAAWILCGGLLPIPYANLMKKIRKELDGKAVLA